MTSPVCSKNRFFMKTFLTVCTPVSLFSCMNFLVAI
uniref:Uncharacterized protein n=1 Tax=Anguilla anguilla TaxID=7936 RepID=A0A0E9XT22_ANGAN